MERRIAIDSPFASDLWMLQRYFSCALDFIRSHNLVYMCFPTDRRAEVDAGGAHFVTRNRISHGLHGVGQSFDVIGM